MNTYDNDTTHDKEPLDGSLAAREIAAHIAERARIESEMQRLFERDHDDSFFETPPQT